MADANLYTIRRDRKLPFRRTVTYNAGKKNEKQAQLVFEPGVDLELSKEELAQCQDLIDSEMIVPADRDAKGRLRVARDRSPQADAALSEAQDRIAELEAENAELRATLEAATEPVGA